MATNDDNALSRYTVDDLLYLMSRLRDPKGGCPWDLKQTFASIVPSTIEEAYEVAEAIEAEDFEHLHEELGDLLFQVIFYAQLGSEAEYFDFPRIVDTLVIKLVRRHPHVFPSGTLQSAADSDAIEESEVKRNWEAIKAAERESKGETGTLAGVANGLPAMTRAFKLQKRAANVGFDWPAVSGVLDKIEEEIRELREAVESQDQAHIQEELGDLLFCCVNAARHLKLEPEATLRQSNRKFERRFSLVERQIEATGRTLSECSVEELENAWCAAKRAESPSKP